MPAWFAAIPAISKMAGGAMAKGAAGAAGSGGKAGMLSSVIKGSAGSGGGGGGKKKKKEASWSDKPLSEQDAPYYRSSSKPKAIGKNRMGN